MLTFVLTGYFVVEAYNAELTTALTRRISCLDAYNNKSTGFRNP